MGDQIMAAYVLGADIGSGSVKLTMLSREGKIAGTAQCEYPTLHPAVGWNEQDPEDWCRAFHTALQALLKETGAKAEEICAIAPDAATHTAVLLDAEKKPIRPAILWTDGRSAEQVAFLNETALQKIRSVCLNAPTTIWTLPQLMWLRENAQEDWKKIRYLLFAKDYLRFRLTGEIATDAIDAAGSMFFNPVTEAWSDELCALGGIDRAWLPKLLDPADVAGSVTAAAAAEFGLAAGTKVLTGTTDTVMEVLAAGSVAPGHTTVKLATAGRICVITRDRVNADFMFNYRHVVPGLWYPGTGTASCAASYRWYRDALGNQPYEDLNRGAEQIPVGSDGLMFHPYLNGELTPYLDSKLRGSYTGISSLHTAAHFTRATLEGVAMSLRDCLEALHGLGVKPGRTRIIGGGAKGTLWRQIVADTLDLEMEKAKVDDSSFGSALLAAVGIGWFSDYAQAAETCIELDSVTAPNPENRAIYNDLFPRYRAIHDALAPIYHGTY